MNYEKRYLVIKKIGKSDIYGYVKLEKDGKVKLNYNLSVFSFFTDIILLSGDKIISEQKNKNLVGKFYIYKNNISDLRVIFIVDSEIFVAGKVDEIVIQKIKNKIQTLNKSCNVIDRIIENIFNISTKFNFYESIKKPLNQLFDSAEKIELLGVVENFNSRWVKVENNSFIQIVGKIYDNLQLSFIALGQQVQLCDNNNSVNIFSTNIGEFMINFYDISTGELAQI